jgi:tetratricopeptide (TPR) repeat protein
MKKVDWASAIEHFKEAIKDKDKDKKKQRKYGVIFIEYFPHREMGICYFQSGDLKRAKDELSISLMQASSKRALKYVGLIEQVERQDNNTVISNDKLRPEKTKPIIEPYVDWYDLFLKGMKEMQQSDWFTAVKYFKKAIEINDKDKKNVKVRKDMKADYFPHREIGICYYNLGDYEIALSELKKSFKETSSQRAKTHINLINERNSQFVKTEKREKIEKYKDEKTDADSVKGQRSNVPSFPAELIISGQKFVEPSGNNALDSEENANILLTLKNRTNYPGDVEVRLTPLTEARGINVVRDIKVGIIKGLEEKKISIPIIAEKDLPNQEVTFRLEVKENYYRLDPAPFLITFKTIEYEKPKLAVILRDFVDKKEISPSNNENGQVEAMEMIKVEISIQNIGGGVAKGVKSRIEFQRVDEGSIFPRTIDGEPMSEIDMGDLKKGEFKRIPFLFFTNTFYKHSDIRFTISTSDSKQISNVEKEIVLPMGIQIQKEKEFRIEQLESGNIEIIAEKSKIIDVDNVPVHEDILNSQKNRLAVIIGIEDYRYNEKATYKKRDATVMYKYMKNLLGIPEKNIWFEINDGATKAQLDYVFNDKDGWLKKRVKQGISEIFVYLAGHGYPDVETNTAYFIPQDVRAEQATYGIALNDIYRKLGNMGSKNVIMFVESCYSGLSADHRQLVSNINPVKVKVRYPEIQGKNLVVITAASGQQVSSNSDDLRHGVFTYHLLKGLKGEADLNKDDQIDIGELWEYLEKNVPEEALNLDREQNPLIFPNVELLKENTLLNFKILGK